VASDDKTSQEEPAVAVYIYTFGKHWKCKKSDNGLKLA